MSPQVQLLSRPDSPHLQAIPADSRFGPAGLVRPLWGYDANHAPPPPPEGARGAAMQHLTITELCDVVVTHAQGPQCATARARTAAVLQLAVGF